MPAGGQRDSVRVSADPGGLIPALQGPGSIVGCGPLGLEHY